MQLDLLLHLQPLAIQYQQQTLERYTISSMMASVVRSTALRAGGACVRCRKGKTKCVYENGRAPCKNCAKGMHECYLPSESMSHGGHGVSPARVQQRARESLPSERTVSSASGDRQGPPASSVSRHVSSTAEKYVSSFYCIFKFIVLCHFSFSIYHTASICIYQPLLPFPRPFSSSSQGCYCLCGVAALTLRVCIF